MCCLKINDKELLLYSRKYTYLNDREVCIDEKENHVAHTFTLDPDRIQKLYDENVYKIQ